MNPAALDDEFANEVVDARPTTASRRTRVWLLVGLLICCAAPRVWMAVRLDTLCNDSLFYIELAEGLERGDLEAGLGRLRLNTYPPVLALLHSVGLDWELAGKCWGVAMASLAVLPLFGWLRRQFDEQLAVVGCLLYAFHPKLIEWSPELIRDPTFWLLWTLGLYSSWRAAAETRLSWYLLSGLVIALAIHTRFEGWFLYLPLVGWSACRQLAVRAQPGTPGLVPGGSPVAPGLVPVGSDAASREVDRTRAGRPGRPSSKRAGSALRGCAAAVVVCPLLLLAINLTWLAGQPRWELGNFNRLEYVTLWSQAVWQAVRGEGHDDARATAIDLSSSADGASTAPAALAAPAQRLPAPEAMPRRMGGGRTLWIFVNTLRRGFGALFGLCWLAGFACRPHLWLRRDHLVLFLVAGCVAAGTWVHLWYAQATSSRYFLAIVVLASPCAAMGCCWACRRLERAASWLFARTSFVPQRIALSRSVAVLALLIIAAGAAELVATRYDGRRREAALGRWVLGEFGPGRRILSPGPVGLIGYYARAASDAMYTESGTPIDKGDLAIALRHSVTPDELAAFIANARRQGMRPIDAGRLPGGYDWRDVVVLTRLKNIHVQLTAKRL